MPASPFVTINEQHAEEAAFLWILRSQAVHAPNYTLDDLATLENRIEAHLQGLSLAGDAGWTLCAQALEGGDVGEVFAASMLALSGPNKERLEEVLRTVEANPETARGMISAMGWRSFDAAKPIADELFAAESPTRKRIGLAAYAIHQKDPGEALDEALAAQDPILCGQALKAVGELGTVRRLSMVEAHLNDEAEVRAFWAAWSATLLGSEAGLQRLLRFSESDSPFADRARRLAPRCLNPAAARALIAKLASNEKTLRGAIIAAGATGYPEHIPWLIRQMNNPKHARVAGESCSILTGLDLAKEQMVSCAPEGFESGPTENPQDEDVGMDPDADLPWPNVRSVAGWWEAKKVRFNPEARLAAEKRSLTVLCPVGN